MSKGHRDQTESETDLAPFKVSITLQTQFTSPQRIFISIIKN